MASQVALSLEDAVAKRTRPFKIPAFFLAHCFALALCRTHMLCDLVSFHDTQGAILPEEMGGVEGEFYPVVFAIVGWFLAVAWGGIAVLCGVGIVLRDGLGGRLWISGLHGGGGGGVRRIPVDGLHGWTGTPAGVLGPEPDTPGGLRNVWPRGLGDREAVLRLAIADGWCVCCVGLTWLVQGLIGSPTVGFVLRVEVGRYVDAFRKVITRSVIRIVVPVIAVSVVVVVVAAAVAVRAAIGWLFTP